MDAPVHLLALPCFAMAAINAYMGVYHLVLALRRPQVREHLPFALLCLVVGAYDLFCSGLYSATSLAQGVFWQRFQFLCMPPITLATVWFVGRFTGTQHSRGVRFTVRLGLVLIPVSIVLSLIDGMVVSEATPSIKHITWGSHPLITYYESDIGPAWLGALFIGLVVYGYLVHLLYRHYRDQPSGTILAVLIGNLLYFAGLTNDAMVAAHVYNFIYATEYAFFAVIVAMGYVLLTRFVDLQCYFEAHNVTLERAVAQRTAALQRSLEQQRAMQAQLVAASRRSGAADVAINVLHNIGNALNSVNVSVDLLEDVVRQSRLPGLSQVIRRICDDGDELSGVFNGTARARQLPQYLAAAAGKLESERASFAAELGSLRRNLEHIKLAVDTQQTHTRAPATSERTSLAAVLDEVIDASVARHPGDAIVQRDYAAVPDVDIDRHKLVQVVATLVDNAWQAVADGAGAARRIEVRLRAVGGDRAAIEVEDTGRGIPPEDLTRIFHHGFAARTAVHGLGLHESACAAAELRGSLLATSEGPGRGACFILTLPLTCGGPGPGAAASTG